MKASTPLGRLLRRGQHVTPLSSKGEPYGGVAIHGLWHSLSPGEIIEVLDDIEPLEPGQTTQAQVGGFEGQRVEASVETRGVMWSRLQGDVRTYEQWFLQPGPHEFILLETPAGTLLITISAPADEWDDFHQVAEEILAGVSFPDLK